MECRADPLYDRSPKNLAGPAFGHGALTFQAWFRAQYGAEEWDSLDKILRPMWMDYLRWYRQVLNIPIENGVSLDYVGQEEDLLKLKVSGKDNKAILCRKLVFASLHFSSEFLKRHLEMLSQKTSLYKTSLFRFRL